MSCDSHSFCDHLDAYLDGDLPSGVEQAFAAHLNSCAACREAVDEQAWINSLLRSEAAAALEAPPELRIRPKHPRLLAMAAAAAIVAVATLIPLPRREGLGEGRPTAAQASKPEPVGEGDPDPGISLPAHSPDATSSTLATGGNPSPDPSLQGRRIREAAAEFVSRGDAVVVPVASEDPQVTVVQLYPTTTARRRAAWRRSLEQSLHN